MDSTAPSTTRWRPKTLQEHRTGRTPAEWNEELKMHVVQDALGGEFGCSKATMAAIYDLLDITESNMVLHGMDLDLCDDARRLIEHGIDLDHKPSVEIALSSYSAHGCTHVPKALWLDAVLMAARGNP